MTQATGDFGSVFGGRLVTGSSWVWGRAPAGGQSSRAGVKVFALGVGQIAVQIQGAPRDAYLNYASLGATQKLRQMLGKMG